MTSARFSWLHFTDLHVGMDGAEWLWPGVEEEVLADLTRLHAKLGKVDAVLFTGDLTQQGSSQEFTRFDEVWGLIRNKLVLLGSNPVFLAVPGNHDLVRPASGTAVLDGLKNWVSNTDLRQRFWTKDENDYRSTVRTAFKAWSTWAERGIDWSKLKDVHRNGLLPGDFAATIEVGDRAIGILGLNTAALQLAAGDYQGRLSVHARQASTLVGRLYEWTANHDACFLLTHHDPSWLDEEGTEALNGEIAKPGRFVAHLCGHRHKQRDTVVVEGGALPRRTVIGRSLFGLETYEHAGDRKERLHGYSAGLIEFGSTRTIRLWPRRDEPQDAGHRVIHRDASVWLDDDDGTAAEDLGPSPKPAHPSQTAGSAPSANLAAPAPLDGWIEITREYLETCRRELDQVALRVFYDGQEPSWAHAQAPADAIPRREIVANTVSRLQNPMSPTLVLLVAAGGEGKSLALRQVVVDLVTAGRRVLWRQDPGKLDFQAVANLPGGVSWILCSDNGEVIGGELAATLKALHDAEQKDVHWLIGARDTDWRARFPRGGRGGGEPSWSRWATVWPRADEPARRAALGLTEADATKVAGAWQRAGSLGKLASRPEADRGRALLEASRQKGGVSNATFFGAILDQRFGAEGLRAHLETVLQRLGGADHVLGNSGTLRCAFLYAAAAEAVGIDGVDLKVVAALLGVPPERRRPEILHRLGQEAMASVGGDALRTRAPAIARTAVQLVEEGRIDEDLEEIYKALVGTTGELVGHGINVGPTHGLIMNCGPRLARELPKLGIDKRRAGHIARTAADEGARVESCLLVRRVTQARTYRETSDPRRGSGILREALAAPDGFVDWQKYIRGALYELAVCEGSIPYLITGLWLTGLSLADGSRLGRVTEEQAKLSLAGLGAACLEIAKRGSLDGPFCKLLRATAVLGPRVTPDWDRKTSGYFVRYAERANRLDVRHFSDHEALELVAAAIRHAGERIDDTDLRDLMVRVADLGPLSFDELRRTLRIGSG